MTAASIIICTYQRAELLRRCLAGCATQVVPDGVRAEVIVVDNASDPQIESLVDRVRDGRSDLDFRYVAEPEVGLSHARNTGARLASGEVVIYLDDDAVPVGDHWLTAYLRAFEDPRVGAAGGSIVPDLDGHDRPAWLSAHLEAKFSILDVPRPARVGDLRRPGPYRSLLLPMGANIAYRRDQVPDFDVRTGRIGAELLSRDELVGIRRIRDAGKEVWLLPDALVRHRIPGDRLTEDWIVRRFRAEGRSRLAERLTPGTSLRAAVLRSIAHAVVGALLAPAILLTRSPGRLLAVRCRLAEAAEELRTAIRAMGARPSR